MTRKRWRFLSTKLITRGTNHNTSTTVGEKPSSEETTDMSLKYSNFRNFLYNEKVR